MKKIKTFLIEHKVLVFLFTFVVVGFLYRIYPSTVVYELPPTDDYVHYYYVRCLIDAGKPSVPGFAPQLMEYIIAGIYLLSGKTLGLLWICKCFNPLVGALTVIPFYYFCRTFTLPNNALMGSALLSVCDLHYYRSAYFGQSETISMFFMFCFLAFYFRKKYILGGVALAAMFYSHILPFMVSIAYIGFHYAISKFSLKRGLILMGIIIGVALLVGSPFSSHLRVAQFLNIQTFISYLDIKNFGIYNLGELWLGIKLMIGTVFVGLIVLVDYLRKPNRNFTSIMLFVSLFGVGLTWLGYDGAAMAPTRVAPYVGLSVISMYSLTDFKWKKQVTGFLFILMFVGPVLLGGINTNLWIYDSATKEEVIALDYMQRSGLINFSETNIEEWYVDRSIATAVWYKIMIGGSMLLSIPQNVTRQAEDVQRLEDSLKKANATGYKYVFYSTRMKNGAFILKYDAENHRMTPYRTPIERPDIDLNEYKVLYDENGVWIYEHR